jgi:arginase
MHVAVLGAPSSIGLRPDDRTGQPQHVAQAPATLRALGAIERLGATDLGDVGPPAYRDFDRPPGRPRNEAEVAEYSRSLGEAFSEGLDRQRFVVVLGGDCSIVLGCLLGARRIGERIGLAYVDAHADFATPEESQTGSVASMGLALAVGRGDSSLAQLDGASPLVRAEDVTLVGRRDADQPSYGHEALARSGILDLPGRVLLQNSVAGTAEAVLARVGRDVLSGFLTLVDCDVINPLMVPAVGSPEPGGPTIDELAAFLIRLVDHPKAIGLALTLYDPSLDTDGSSGGHLVSLLASVFR